MKQHVNLYLPEFRKQQDWLDAVRMLQLFGLGLLLLGVATGYEYFDLFRHNRAYAAVEVQRQTEASATAALRASYGNQSEDPNILAEIAQVEGVLQTKQAILQFMTGRDLGNTAGFSEYLADLARYHTQGLSLSGIKLEDGGGQVTLVGSVLKAELVPIYLQSLSEGASYRGKDFYTVQISEAAQTGGEAPSWLFAVSTTTQTAAR